MDISLHPFNLELLTLTAADLKSMTPVKVLDIFTASSRNFHPEGLFSTEIFGKVGEERRNRMFSYIDLKVEILHPVIYKVITDLKALYGDIMASKEYAVFDPVTKDFVKSTPIDGETGYNFFLKNFHKLELDLRNSTKRSFNIKLIKKYKDQLTLSKFLVLPAGLRDYVIDEIGKPSEDEINGYYRKLLSLSNMIDNVDPRINPEYFDHIRYNMQLAVMTIYEYIKNILEGKHGFILGKWAARKVFNSTRNVITPYIPTLDKLDSPVTVSTNQTVIGLYQYLRATLPLAIKHVRDNYLSNVFVGPNSPAVLINKKTLKKEMVSIDPSIYDEWMTFEGLEKTMARYGEEHIRHEVVTIDDYYLLLVYKGNDGTYKIIQDIDELPDNRKSEPDCVTPITFTELLYLSVYKDSDTIPALVTRYPITGYGSIYPSYLYLKTTTKSEVRTELDDNWQPTENIAREFPLGSWSFYNTMSPSHSHLKRLTADFDGDTMSLTCLLTEESKEEVKKALNSRNYYVGLDGKMVFSASSDIIDLVLVSMTS